jgi:Leucine-rich repeat (LRR) protein
MKQILLMIAVVALVGCADEFEIVPEKLITNPIVEKAIKVALNKPPEWSTDSNELTKVDLAMVTKLSLGSTKITDADLKELAKMQQLTDLDLSYTKITDAGRRDIAKMKQLTDLYLRDTKITDAGAAELRKAMPKCEINHW